jgi:hypothetical protein
MMSGVMCVLHAQTLPGAHTIHRPVFGEPEPVVGGYFAVM